MISTNTELGVEQTPFVTYSLPVDAMVTGGANGLSSVNLNPVASSQEQQMTSQTEMSESYLNKKAEGLVTSLKPSVSENSQIAIDGIPSAAVQNTCCCSTGITMYGTGQNSTSFISSVLKELDIDKKNVSKKRRKYISASDDRKSSATISLLFVVVTASFCGIIILSDLMKILQDIKGNWAR